jgi:hypothetical protein
MAVDGEKAQLTKKFSVLLYRRAHLEFNYFAMDKRRLSFSRESAAFVQVTRRDAQADEGIGLNTSGTDRTRSEDLGVVCLTMPFLI